MDTDIAASWNPKYQEAVRELTQEKATYVTKEDIELQKTSDPEPWEPSAEIKLVLPKSGNIEVLLVGKDVELMSVHNHLVAQKHLGLVLLGPVISRKSEPLLIIITTKTILYVLDPNDENSMMFLKTMLARNDLRFYTTNGLEDADCLYHNYGIDLSSEGAQVTCCAGIHVYLMRLMRSYPPTVMDMFSNRASSCSRRSEVKIEKFTDLIEMWLDIAKEEVQFGKEQLIHLNIRPLTMTARNIIKKRCILVLPLAMEMERLSLLEAGIMSRNAFDLLISSSSDINSKLRQFTIERFKQAREEGRGAHVGYYNHLDIVCEDLTNIYIGSNREQQTSFVCK